MLDGRIDTQGTVNDLRDQGILEKVVLDELNATQGNAAEITEEQAIDSVKSTKDVSEILKKPRKLVKDEFRATGGVKWSIYKSYLQASCVHEWSISRTRYLITLHSSYWTWIILLIIAVIMQLLGVTEKLWIKVSHPFQSYNEILLMLYSCRLGAKHTGRVQETPLQASTQPRPS